MSFFNKLDKHAGLVSGMSDRVGVDWPQAIEKSPEAAMEYRNAVLKCAGCNDVAACQGWQASHETAENPPEYCLNGEVFEGLKNR